MLISKSDGDLKHFVRTEVKNLAALEDIILNHNYSLGVFKDGERNKKNFISAECIGLDFDKGLQLWEAKKLFKDFKHVIATTRNHKKEKNGVVSDRFRVILFLSYPITDANDFEATWRKLADKYPACDPACKDASRLFYPSNKVVSTNMDQDATLIEPIKYVAPAKIEITKINERIEPNISRLSKRTLTFLLEGAELGTRHNELVKAAADAKEQGYSQDEFENMVAVMADKTGRFTWPDLGHSKAISDMFSKDSRYPPREGLEEPRTAFRFQTIDQLIEEKIELNWVVEDLLTEGGFSLIVGKAKTGKSTLVRQLVRCVCRGEPFLGRKTKQGRVLYLALEEQKAMLKTQFQAVGIAKKDPLLIHVGGVLSDSALYDLESALLETKPALLVVDTLFLLLNVQDGNSYGEMNRVLTTYRELARRTGTHIISIHHQNKNQFGGFDSIMGSSAIHGAADNVLLFTGDKTKRFITSSQRGGKAFKNQMLSFNEPIQTYSLSNNSVIPNSCLDDF